MTWTRGRRLAIGLLTLAGLVGAIPGTPASAVTTTVPADTTTVPADTTTVPADTTTVPADTTTVPAESATCTEVRLPAALAALKPKDFILAGTLCVPTSWAAGRHTVDVLVHGGMYNRQYWDWPIRPEVYSYARRTVGAGRAAFFYDRFGAGRSSRPASIQASYAADVYGLHQVIGWLRSSLPAVNSIGHSLGSAVVLQKAGQFHDADRVVVTGLTHGHGLGYLTLPAAIYPAALDPQFSSQITLLDGGYVTTLPGKRAGLFYSASAEPDVIAWDEAHKDVMTESQASEAIIQLSQPPLLNWSNRISAPVLMANGQQDYPFCNIDVSCLNDAALTAAERIYFTGAESFIARTIPDTGHDLPLHPSAGTSFGIINT